MDTVSIFPAPDFPADGLICFSHLRWNFVFQRPQHIMSRLAALTQVAFFEEPEFDATTPRLEQRICPHSKVEVLTPHLPPDLRAQDIDAHLQHLLDEYRRARGLDNPVLWYYTPMMLRFSQHVPAAAVVYDCMDELANFDFAPPELLQEERRLVDTADLIFTGGRSLYEAKRGRHRSVHCFPSAIDFAHFSAARSASLGQPEDQHGIPYPRLGFFGVLDERMDWRLLEQLARSRPDWQLVMVGPVVKVDPATLPRLPNIHYLGQKNYAQLPAYLAHWDVALMPFALNEATRFISPTKTPEYLAGGRPVVSTAITDVRHTYGAVDAVHIAEDATQFVRACEKAMKQRKSGSAYLQRADKLLATMSWDATAAQMLELIGGAVQRRSLVAAATGGITTPHIRRKAKVDYLIVGAGFAGSVLAERLAAGSGKRVLLSDRRPHIGGNAYDHYDDSGILIHKYGPHIFHTNAPRVAEYLSRFTRWRPYEHRVLAQVERKLLPMPINRTTLNQLYGLTMENELEAAAFLASQADGSGEVRSAQDAVVSQVGWHLYRLFFEGYTSKQWGMAPTELDKSVTARVPARTSTDDRYFTDSFQAMPERGYTHMFENMLDQRGISIELGVDYREIRNEVDAAHTIYTGPIDEFFDWRYGPLPYRSIQFRHCSLPQPVFQPVAVVNYPDRSTPWTRITEYKHLTGQVAPNTSITYEFPAAEGDPYYPIPQAENQVLFKRYEALADRSPDVSFVGRLATYRYYNMDQVVAQALATWKKLERSEAASTAAIDLERLPA